MSRHKRVVKAAAVLKYFLQGMILLVFLSGCATVFPKFDNSQELQPNEVIVVGHVDLLPPLTKDEMDFSITVREQEENQVYYWLHSKPTPIAEDPFYTSRETFVRGTLGETFYLRVPRQRWYATMGHITVAHTGSRLKIAWLPAGFVIEPQPDDKAIYIGTFRYHRNEFWDLTKTEEINDFEAVRAEFRAKFGSKLKLVDRLAQPYELPTASN